MNYYESLKGYFCNDYLSEHPTEQGALSNAKKPGNASILPNSNNRALIISDGSHIYLQSYDTLILDYDRAKGIISRLWYGYSVTTLKHINEFLRMFGAKKNLNKADWNNFTEYTF